MLCLYSFRLEFRFHYILVILEENSILPASIKKTQQAHRIHIKVTHTQDAYSFSRTDVQMRVIMKWYCCRWECSTISLVTVKSVQSSTENEL